MLVAKLVYMILYDIALHTGAQCSPVWILKQTFQGEDTRQRPSEASGRDPTYRTSRLRAPSNGSPICPPTVSPRSELTLAQNLSLCPDSPSGSCSA